MSHRSIPLLLLSQLLFFEIAEAATIRVPSDQPTILSGLDAAVAGDTVLVAPGTYGGLDRRDAGTACGFLKPDVVLRSEGGSSSTFFDLNGEQGDEFTYYLIGSPFNSGHASIEGFTFRGAAAGVLGIFIFSDDFMSTSSATIRDCHFEDLVGTEVSLGATAFKYVDIDFYDCSFLRCIATGYYGASAITNIAGDMKLDRCRFEECSGGAIDLLGPFFARDINAPNTLLVQNCEFLRNVREGYGGAIQTHPVWSSQIIENSVFIGNEALGGGALEMLGLGTKEVRNCLFANNKAMGGGVGGGAIASDRKLNVMGCTFWENSQVDFFNGGAAIDGLVLRLERNIFARNFGSVAVWVEYLEPDGGCNDYWENPDGNVGESNPYPTDIFVDPLFCDPENENWYLTKGSPCLPENSGECGLIGVFSVGCGTVNVERSSWGRIKELYR